LHGRPGPHPQQGHLAEAVGGEFEFIDFKLRWLDRNRPRPYVIASWVVCAAVSPDRKEYDLFLIDNLHVSPVLMKRLFLRDDQKIAVHLGSHTLYFLLSHYFSPPVEKLHLWALRNYDAIICEGQMAVEIANRLLGKRRPPIYETFIGLPSERMQRLLRVQPDLESRRIVFVGSGPGEFRMHYKGLDLMVEAMSIALETDPTMGFDVVGEWDEDIIERLTAIRSPAARERIRFLGRVEAITDVLEGAALYLHCARGDATPTAAIEAMAAGVVPLVSEWTGARQLVIDVCEKLIAPLDAAEIAARIAWYFALPSEERQRLSERTRYVARGYTEDRAAEHYRATFQAMYKELGFVSANSRRL